MNQKLRFILHPSAFILNREGRIMPRRRWLCLVCLVLWQPGCVLLETAGMTARKPGEEGQLPPAESVKLCLAVAEQLANQGHLPEAVDQLQKARLYDPRADVSAPLARLYARMRKDRDALDEFARATDAHPRDAELYNDLGYFHYLRASWTEAEVALRRAVQLAPDHARAWVNLGLALGQQGRYEESLDAFSKAVRPAEARCNLAFVLATQGKRDEARQAYREALEMDPGLKLAREALARLIDDKVTR
jgi:Tfp pilus assembly protein PilF